MEDGVRKPVRVKGTEVFIGGLQQSTTEEMLRGALSGCGDITEIRMMKDQKGNLKGYAFVRFSTREAAVKAQREKHGAMVQGKKLRVLPSTDQDRIFVGSLKKEWTQKEVDSMIRQAFQDVVDVELAVIPDSEGSSGSKRKLNRGFAFVTFRDHPAAARAYRIGNKPDFTLEGNWHPIIDWAQSDIDFDPDEMAKVTVAFVSNLPTNATEDFLRELFEPFGKLDRVAISRKADFPVGFVHYTSRSELDAAIQGLDGKTVKGPDKGQSVKLQVAVSKPVDKSKKRSRDEIEDGPRRSGAQKLDPASIYVTPSSLAPPQTFVDPYELAVLGLHSNVTEKLLQMFRRGLVAQHEVDANVLEDLRELPEDIALDVLDKFASVNLMDIRNKGGYLRSLIRKSERDLGSSRKASKKAGGFSERGGKPLQNGLRNVGAMPPHTSLLDGYRLNPRLAAESELLGYGGYGITLSAVPLTGGLSNSSVLSRTSSALGDALSLPSYRSSSAALGLSGVGGIGSLGGLGSYSGLGNTSSYSSIGGLGSIGVDLEAAAPDRRPYKFDPYTGEAFKFDPFTGEPLQQSGVSSNRLGSRFL